MHSVSKMMGWAGVLILMVAQAQAQDYKPKKELKYGQAYMEEKKYHKAIEHLERVVKVWPDHIQAQFDLGYAYIHSKHHNEKPKAVEHLKQVIELRKAGKDVDNQFWDAKYFLAQAYHSNHQFDDAEKYYRAFLREIRGTTDMELVAQVERHIKQCQYGKEMIDSPLRVKIENLGPVVNSKWPDYAPVISADESLMIFTSRRPNTTGGDKDPNDDLYYEDLYLTRWSAGGWTKPQNMGDHINDKGHDASIALSPDGKILFIYADKHKRSYSDILYSKWDGEDKEWTKPRGLGDNINGKFTEERSVTITEDNRTIYFSSNREGGFGGYDIYKSEWISDKDEWGPAVNLGPKINTPGDDEAPFIHPDGTLYFSSDGHEVNIGHHDIYFVTQEKSGWGDVTNIGYPINTAEDDLFFVLSGNKNNAYYSSEKSEGGYGEKDLYVIRMPTKANLEATRTKEIAEVKPIKSKLKPLKVQQVKTQKAKKNITILTGTVVDEDSKEPLKAKIRLVDNVRNKLVDSVMTNELTGNYVVTLPAGKNYGLIIDKEDYLFHSENFDLQESEGYSEDTLNVELKKIEIGKAIVLNNIFYDYGKATLRPESKAELARIVTIMNENPTIKVEISGHTDSDGSDAFNKDLSERRAQSVVSYLIEHGILKDRLVAKGYGESKPIASNKTEEGKQMNRRTEFTILEN